METVDEGRQNGLSKQTVGANDIESTTYISQNDLPTNSYRGPISRPWAR
jgi:hypothetical protein